MCAMVQDNVSGVKRSSQLVRCVSNYFYSCTYKMTGCNTRVLYMEIQPILDKFMLKK